MREEREERKRMGKDKNETGELSSSNLSNLFQVMLVTLYCNDGKSSKGLLSHVGSPALQRVFKTLQLYW